MQERSVRPYPASEAPHRVDHTINQEFLDRSHGRELCANSVAELLECVLVFSREDIVLGKEAVPERVETDHGFPLRCFWSGGMESVCLVSSLLSFARHGSRPPLTSLY